MFVPTMAASEMVFESSREARMWETLFCSAATVDTTCWAIGSSHATVVGPGVERGQSVYKVSK